MQIERSEFLRAGPHERNEDRRGYANGFRGKQMKTRLGKLDLRIPRVRGLEPDEESFYPKALERGERKRPTRFRIAPLTLLTLR